MIYRKASPQPTRLLLRIVAGAGAGALLGATACGGDDSSNHHILNGTLVMPSSGSSEGGADVSHPVGVVPFNEGGISGIVIMPVGGGIQPEPEDAGHMLTGALALPDQ
jgi:hypothetical protein